MGNRGVQSERVVNFLIVHLQDSDAESRQWAVEGLALSGTDQTIDTLLKAMHDDASPMVRERAACSLAESGMFIAAATCQRDSGIVGITPTIRRSTRRRMGGRSRRSGILRIRRLPNDSAAWREWYSHQ